MIELAQRPKRPPVLIAALVALLFSLLAIRFNWARVAATVALTFLTIQWLPGAIEYVDEERTRQAAIYVVIGTAFFAMGAVLAYLTPSNRYYRQAAQWRKSRNRPST